MDQLIGTVFGRWYVTLFGLTFLWQASRHLGWRRTGIYFAVAPRRRAGRRERVGAPRRPVHPLLVQRRPARRRALRRRRPADGPAQLHVHGVLRLRRPDGCSRRARSAPGRRGRGTSCSSPGCSPCGPSGCSTPSAASATASTSASCSRYEGPGFWFGLPLGSQLGLRRSPPGSSSSCCTGSTGRARRRRAGGLRDHPAPRRPHHLPRARCSTSRPWPSTSTPTPRRRRLLIWVPAAVHHRGVLEPAAACSTQPRRWPDAAREPARRAAPTEPATS